MVFTMSAILVPDFYKNQYVSLLSAYLFKYRKYWIGREVRVSLNRICELYIVNIVVRASDQGRPDNAAFKLS